MTTTPEHGTADRPSSDVAAEALAVNWELASRWGGRLASPGPTADRTDLERLVASLRDAATRALPMALEASRLGAAVSASGRSEQRAEILVVDRPGWARAVGQSFEAMTSPVAGTAGGSSGARPTPATAQAAGLLGVLAGRVLGQFDPFAHGAPAGGRLLLVAPNVLRMERLLSADPEDFRLWVCLHEQTHALQFAAAPWLADHLLAEVTGLVQDLASTTPAQELSTAAAAARRALRRPPWRRPVSERGPDDGLGLLALALNASQRERVDRITAVMSLLEGHADVTMDAVGAAAIPSVQQLRARLESRRASTGLDQLIGRLFGMEAKMAQYRRGAAFVREVRRLGGAAALDAAWSGPEGLPRPGEIGDPAAWVQRVLGSP